MLIMQARVYVCTNSSEFISFERVHIATTHCINERTAHNQIKRAINLLEFIHHRGLGAVVS